MNSVVEYFLDQIQKYPDPATLIFIEDAEKRMQIDYRFVQAFKRSTKKKALLLTGFDSGWEGITETACALIERGYNVILMSLPGYGNSGDPPLIDVSVVDNFSPEGRWLNLFLEQFYQIHGDDYEMHFVGHSMGAAILAEAAAQKGCVAKSLTMIAPSNTRSESWLLPLKFAWSGLWMRIACRKEWENLYGVLQPQKSAWTNGRWRQRLLELHRLKCGRPLQSTLQNVEIPYKIIVGGKDIVYPPKIFQKMMKREPENVKCIGDFYHNSTIPHARELADVIVKFVKGK